MPVRSAGQTYSGALAAALWEYSAHLIDTITAATAATATGTPAAPGSAPAHGWAAAAAAKAARTHDEGFTFAQVWTDCGLRDTDSSQRPNTSLV